MNWTQQHPFGGVTAFHLALIAIIGALIPIPGCDRGASRPSKAEIDKAVGEAVDKAAGELGKRLDALNKELDRKLVRFLIDGVRDQNQERELTSKLQGLKDAGSESSRFGSQGAYCSQGDRYFWVSPISDLESMAGRIDFGLVVAMDPAERIVLVDASAKPAPRPEKGWPAAEAIDRYVIQKTTAFAVTQLYDESIKKYGRDKVVAVWVPEVPGVAPSEYPTVKKLRTLAPGTTATAFSGFGPSQKNFTTVTVAPTPSLDAVVRALDGAETLAVDPERRVVLLGNLADLKPPTAKTLEPQAAPPK